MSGKPPSAPWMASPYSPEPAPVASRRSSDAGSRTRAPASRGNLILRSPHADITVPVEDLSSFVLGAGRGLAKNIALVDGVTGRAVTYDELREQVRRVAAGLARRGITKGDVIAL